MRRASTGWLPPRSPYSLIQEDVWSSAPESGWLVLVVCMMLNCTSRKQVEKVLPEFRQRWPTPESFVNVDSREVAVVIRSLGFANRRAANLQKMTACYLSLDWDHAEAPPGVGPYAAASWEIFCAGAVPIERPKDGALGRYWRWLVTNGGRKDADGQETAGTSQGR